MTQMKLKDSRIKMMNEVLNGIKVCRNIYIYVVVKYLYSLPSGVH